MVYLIESFEEFKEVQINKIEKYLNDKNFKYEENEDEVIYDINNQSLVIGISKNGYYCLDDKTNTKFTSLKDIKNFYKI